MKHLYTLKVQVTSFWIYLLGFSPVMAQTPPVLTTGLKWDNWYYTNTVQEILTQFNAGRRHEETNRSLPSNILGTLSLPSDFLNRNFQEQALILLNAERQARHGVNYGGSSGTVLGLPFEAVEINLSEVAQLHAQDMQTNNFFGHTGSNGQSSTTRINNAFSGCTESTGENIAWNSAISASLFSGQIAVAIYNFIYDDACCAWGHRNLCLKQSNTTNNYDGSAKYGLVGFGFASGTNGDYFVMDFFDPKPLSATCSYQVTNFEEGQGNCPDEINLTGMIETGMYQAQMTVQSSGYIPSSEVVDFMASSSIELLANFEVSAGSELNIELGLCGSAPLRMPSDHALIMEETISHPSHLPQFKIE